MLKSFSCLNFITTAFKLSSLGNDVLNKSPAIRIKSTSSFMHLSTALLKASVLVSLSFGSLHEPIWQSARCANFILPQLAKLHRNFPLSFQSFLNSILKIWNAYRSHKFCKIACYQRFSNVKISYCQIGRAHVRTPVTVPS